jgi:putative DNA primase/helicase
MKISTGKSRMDKYWKLREVSWDDFFKELSRTTYTRETQEEYKQMKKNEQDNVKDVGGFVAGELKDGRRKKENVVSRSMLTLDIDYADKVDKLVDHIDQLADHIDQLVDQIDAAARISVAASIDADARKDATKVARIDADASLGQLSSINASSSIDVTKVKRLGQLSSINASSSIDVTKSSVYAYCIYSTHKHTPEKPRLRLIIPLSREVSGDEYKAISRMIAKQIGIELFDDTTYEPNRLMYWPSTSSDGEYFFKSGEGTFLNPDNILNLYDNWKDSSSWPVSSRQKAVISKLVTKQLDPTLKDGMVGAFCRSYSIEEAIEKFLPEVYTPSVMPERYDYAPADSTAGVVIYEGKYAYSHHATDPACGMLLNAFDLVRIHLFGDEFKNMLDLCAKDEKVKRQLSKERQEAIAAEFAEDASDQGDEWKLRRDYDYQLNQEDSYEKENEWKLRRGNDYQLNQKEKFEKENDCKFNQEDDWQVKLELNKNGTVKDTPINILTIIKKDERLKAIAYNQMTHLIDVNGTLPWKQVKPGWNDSDLAHLKMYFDRHYGIWSPNKIRDALLSAASDRLFHPIKEYFKKLPVWDGTERVDTLLIDYLGAVDNKYTRAVMRKTLIAAVARIFEPGVKFDYILVLNGPQGIGKSTFFAKLGGRWFSDSLTLSDMRDKSGAEKLQGYWVLELGELAGLRKMDVETVKSFITRTDDKFRQSYGVNVENHPRQCIVVGTTNNTSGFLRDITGNRRFWPVRVTGGVKKVWEMNDVDQIWAEAIAKYKEGEEIFLTGDEEVIAIEEQRDALESDDREGLIQDYLETLLPENWNSLDLYERRTFLAGESEFGTSHHRNTQSNAKQTEAKNLSANQTEANHPSANQTEANHHSANQTEANHPYGATIRQKVCVHEIWCECLGRDKAHLSRRDSQEIIAILMRIGGWEIYTGNKQGQTRFAIYGNQKTFCRRY